MSESGTDLAAEVKAMGTVGDALERLDEPARQRVLDWAAERFGAPDRMRQLPRADHKGGAGAANEQQSVPAAQQGEFKSISEVFDAANPGSGPDRALVAAYWFQTLQGSENFAGQQINDELKHMGHGLVNVTKTLTDLAERTPALVRQVQKIGKSRQGRKRYRLTLEGERRVRRLIGGEGQSENDN